MQVASLAPKKLGWSEQSIDGSGVSRSAYRLSSTSPIVAYQFNPLDNEFVFSNDGSLLLPSHTYGNDYFALTFPTLDRRPFAHRFHGYLSIVASEPGTTRVRVTLSADSNAGAQQPTLFARQPTEFDLEQFEVLHLEAAERGDFTGSRVEVVTPARTVGVFVGHEAAVITDLRPDQNSELQICCADHMEEQLFPAATWGQSYTIGLTKKRSDQVRGGEPAPDFVRILARKDNTTVTIQPPVRGSCDTLAAGEYCNLFADQHTQISADQPILVAQYLLSTDGRVGDPAMAFVAPTEQFRTQYAFLTPQEYDENYATIISRNGAQVILDGQDVSSQLNETVDDQSIGVLSLQPGQHIIECSAGCGVLVYGFSQAVSYLFAGGLDLEPISDF